MTSARETLSFKEILLAFLLSRALIFILVLLSCQITVRTEKRAPIRHAELILSADSILKGLTQVAVFGDATWYARIAEQGYTQEPFSASEPRNWAFFPLLPLLERVLKPLTGGFISAGMVIANLCSLLCFFLLPKLMTQMGFSLDSSRRALLFLAFFPTTYFLNLPLTESPFLALSLGAFLAAARNRDISAGVLVGLAASCRAWGVLVGIAIVLSWVVKGQSIRSLLTLRRLISMLLMPLGLLAFMVHLFLLTGEPLAFLKIQSAWGRGGGLFSDINPAMLISDWNFAVLNLAGVALVLSASAFFIRRREYPFAVLLGLAMLSALNSGTTLSFHRFTVTLFPVFIFLGEVTKSPYAEKLVLGCCLVLLTILSIMLGAHFTAAIA